MIEWVYFVHKVDTGGSTPIYGEDWRDEYNGVDDIYACDATVRTGGTFA